MKRTIALAALAAACCLCVSAEDVAYEYKLSNATPKPNDQVTSVTGITMTYCVGGGGRQGYRLGQGNGEQGEGRRVMDRD